VRYAAFILGVVGLIGLGFIAWRWTTNEIEMKNNKELFEFARLLAADDPKAQSQLAEFEKQSKALPYVYGGFVLAAIGCVLVMLRWGLVAATAMLGAVLVPGLMYGPTVIFSCPLVLAAILSIFIRRPAQAVGLPPSLVQAPVSR
jgi:hypothetical protein